MKSRRLGLAALPLGLFAAMGCEAGGGNTTGAVGGSASASTVQGSTSQASTADVGSTTDAVSSSNGFSSGSEMSSGIGGNSCTSSSVETEPVPLDIIILLDESGSMGGAKWDTVTAALKSFVTDPMNDGIGVGIRYFPVDTGPDCNFTDYAQLDVDVAPLPGNSTLLVNSINAEFVTGGTPTYGALRGVLTKATAYQDLFPDHKVIVVFASDGDPNGCSAALPSGGTPDIDDIADLAQSALNYNGVQTYVIAMQGATIGNLDKIAAKGGTVEAYDVTGSVAQFSSKMQEIRATALPCEFVIPPPPMGEMLDPKLVNVNYTPGGTMTKQGVPKADNLADCGTGKGWYYDNEMNPTKVILCPASCNIVKSDTGAKVDVAFGCSTIPN